MARRTYTPEQIINKLREAEVLISQGATAAEASRKISVTEQTYLPMAERVRWHARRAGQETQRTGEGERASQEAGSRYITG